MKKENIKNPIETNEQTEVEEVKADSVNFYPDIQYNRKERSKTVVLASIMILLMGGMGITMFIGGVIYKENNAITFIMGALVLVIMFMAISMIPTAFKQYPVKDEPIIEIRRKEITVNKTIVFKVADVQDIKITYTLAPVSNKKEENEAFLDSILKKEPEKGVTANVDIVVKDKGDKLKTYFTTVANSYECLLALYKVGCKHYTITYSMKKLCKKSTFSLGDSVDENGVKLSTVSKKDRLKQLY